MEVETSTLKGMEINNQLNCRLKRSLSLSHSDFQYRNAKVFVVHLKF